MTLEVRRVETRQDLRAFIDLPYRLHAGDPHWIPLLRMEVRKILGSGNPFWSHADHACFLAVRDGKTVGRIAAIVDYNHIRFHDETVGFWGFFESIEDPEVADSLFAEAEDFLCARGVHASRGPMNPSTNDECGLLIDGFDTPPRLMMPHNPPYYRDLVEHCGYGKIKDLYAYSYDITSEPLKRLERLSRRVRNHESSLIVRPINLKDFNRELQHVLDIYNSAWEKNWGFVPMDDDEVLYMAKRLKPLVEPRLLQLAFIEDEPAGFIMSLPDYNQVLRGLDGRLFPLNLFKILIRSRHIDALRVFTMGTKPEFRTRGLDAVLYGESFRAALDLGYKKAEFSWILEDNYLIQKVADMVGADRYKTYRIYERMLKEAA